MIESSRPRKGKSATRALFQGQVSKLSETRSGIQSGLVIARLHREKVIDLAGNLSAVGRLQLLHDVADVHLDRALPQLQFIGDDLVGFARRRASTTSAWRATSEATK